MDRQSMYCHDCQQEFTVEIDTELDGNHVFECPHCDHEHCRVVIDGRVTDKRWDQRNGRMPNTYYATTSTATMTIAFDTAPTGSMTSSGTGTGTSTFLAGSWANASSSSNYFITGAS